MNRRIDPAAVKDIRPGRSTRVVRSIVLSVLATALLTTCGGDDDGGSVGGGGNDGSQSASVVAQHALAQTGLAIALASTVLQSQLEIIFTSVAQSTNCTALTGGGSVQGDTTAKTVTVYYDTACTQRYIVASPVSTQTTTSDGPQFTVAETATYYGLGGAAIGSMSLNETATNITATNTLQVHGTGTFTPAGAAPTPVQLGLYCAVPNFINNGPVPSPEIASCGGGIAQDFPALNLAIGAVTPLTLSVATDPTTGAATSLTFTGGGSAVTGAPGSLSLANPSPTSLVINGGTAYATTTASGSAAAFALFPPTPTSWNLTDAANDVHFQISVIDNTTRSLNMTITRTSSGGSLATATLDQSGTGSITYSDDKTAAITNWTLAD
ncbi:MAG TPA: hypothetical protein VMH77_04630 [Steroidobacteraceae bacterium]|nr:hypothetical protein [Steroidobacteraceae bacterium]